MPNESVCGQRLIRELATSFSAGQVLDATDTIPPTTRHEVVVNLETLVPDGFIDTVASWMALARAHARSGDPALISGYLGKSDVLTTRLQLRPRRMLTRLNAIMLGSSL